jgi:hypothetical protein
MNIVFGKDLFYGIDAGLDGGFIAGGAILSQQVFQYIGGNDGVALDRFDKVLANRESGEMRVDFLV